MVFGQAELLKHQLTERLYELEKAAPKMPPARVVSQAQTLLEEVQQAPRWDDSRHSISASFWNLWEDTDQYNSYLRTVDITARLRALIAGYATKLSNEEAEQLGVTRLKNLNPKAAQEFIETTQRLSRPGGMAAEIARETPEPFAQEAARRGEQAYDVAKEAYAEASPIIDRTTEALEKEQILNPLLVITCISMFIFMKNKYLAIILIIVLVYLAKKRQIANAGSAVERTIDSASNLLPN